MYRIVSCGSPSLVFNFMGFHLGSNSDDSKGGCRCAAAMRSFSKLLCTLADMSTWIELMCCNNCTKNYWNRTATVNVKVGWHIFCSSRSSLQRTISRSSCVRTGWGWPLPKARSVKPLLLRFKSDSSICFLRFCGGIVVSFCQPFQFFAASDIYLSFTVEGDHLSVAWFVISMSSLYFTKNISKLLR